MGFLSRIFPAIGVFWGTLMIGGLQGELFQSISHSGAESPKSKELMAKIVSTAWNVDSISSFYQQLAFSKQDLEIMYYAAVKGAPNIVFEEKYLFATFFLINKRQEFCHKLRSISQSVNGKSGTDRETELVSQINMQIQECLATLNRE